MVARNPDDRYQTMTHLGEDLDACIAGRRPSALAASWSDMVDQVKAKPALASIPAAAVLLLGLAVHAAVTEPTVPAEAAPESTTSTDSSVDNFIGAFGAIPGVLAEDKRGSKRTPNSQSDGEAGRRKILLKKALVVLADKSYDQNELNDTLDYLKKYGFEPTITAGQKGKLHSRFNQSGNNGHVYVKKDLAAATAEEYFSIVLMTGDSSYKFNGGTRAGQQLQQQLRKTLAMHGAIVGIGKAQSIVTDESISGKVRYEECDGLCIGDPKQSSGSVIKVVESKNIPKMAWQLSVRFDEAKKKLGSR
jgi:hypothetical protein